MIWLGQFPVGEETNQLDCPDTFLPIRAHPESLNFIVIDPRWKNRKFWPQISVKMSECEQIIEMWRGGDPRAPYETGGNKATQSRGASLEMKEQFHHSGHWRR